MRQDMIMIEIRILTTGTRGGSKKLQGKMTRNLLRCLMKIKFGTGFGQVLQNLKMILLWMRLVRIFKILKIMELRYLNL